VTGARLLACLVVAAGLLTAWPAQAQNQGNTADRVRIAWPRDAGTHGRRPPAARSYVVKQSRRPIRSGRDFGRAQTLCRGRCGFDVTLVGAKVRLAVTDLRPRTTYYYAVAARDNVSGRRGRRSPTVKARTRR